jgi:hypothetical protein
LYHPHPPPCSTITLGILATAHLYRRWLVASSPPCSTIGPSPPCPSATLIRLFQSIIVKLPYPFIRTALTRDPSCAMPRHTSRHVQPRRLRLPHLPLPPSYAAAHLKYFIVTHPPTTHSFGGASSTSLSRQVATLRRVTLAAQTPLSPSEKNLHPGTQTQQANLGIFTPSTSTIDDARTSHSPHSTVLAPSTHHLRSAPHLSHDHPYPLMCGCGP